MIPDPPDTHVVTAACGHTCEADDIFDGKCPDCQFRAAEARHYPHPAWLPPGFVRALEGSDPWEGRC